MTAAKTTLSLTGKIAYQDEITAAQAAKIIAFLNAEEGEEPVLGEPAGLGTQSDREAPPKLVENPRDAIVRSGAKTNPEKIAALAAYVLQDSGETVKADAIKSQFQRARESTPAKFARDLSIAISSGWMAEADGGELYLTNSLAGIFEEGFAFPRSNSAPRSRAGKGTKAKAGVPESFAGIDSFDSTMPGYPPYSKMKSQKERLLWVLVYMRDVHGRKAMTNKEIEWLTDHIGTGIPNPNITGAFNSAKSPGFATRSTQDKSIKVTESGVQFLTALANSADA